ncbi:MULTISPECIES: hypothetical protein [Lactococcus]|uniref:Uncharacterized protein n=2 Tax=Lactococcus TaxID=1357 RepID=A0A387BD36_9LACT|nr:MULTISPECIES: hypothetical protein [Lactococcus]AYG01815.1 hypothetical protein D7I46_12565 [Lactococcus allomyrinae]MCL2113653.1 hypothetical protein [Streptococcaceae bacterium]QDK70631.1 hypothetical protein FLP15_04910 [Lactococcus protaetiae]
MENKLEELRLALEKMEIVTIRSAIDKTGLNRKEIINFVCADKHLRIFDDEKNQWINENVDGHC